MRVIYVSTIRVVGGEMELVRGPSKEEVGGENESWRMVAARLITLQEVGRTSSSHRCHGNGQMDARLCATGAA